MTRDDLAPLSRGELIDMLPEKQAEIESLRLRREKNRLL